MKFCEVFKSIQGEGEFAGVPSIFARVNGCNLRCCFAGGSICDTDYTSYYNEDNCSDNDDDLMKLIIENPQIKHIVFTGGEPLLYKEGLDEVVRKIREYDRSIGDWHIITIETNGTLTPLDEPIELYSVSLKLKTSVPSEPCTVKTSDGGEYVFSQKMIDHLNEVRADYSHLRDYANHCNTIQFKFVYSGKESVEEIDDIYSEHIQWMANAMVDIMPEGMTDVQLQQFRKEAAELCVERGWHYTDRLHIIIWGTKRRV